MKRALAPVRSNLNAAFRNDLPVLMLVAFVTLMLASGLSGLTATVPVFVDPWAWNIHVLCSAVILAAVAMVPGGLRLDGRGKPGIATLALAK